MRLTFFKISEAEQTEVGTVPVALLIPAPHQLAFAVLPVGVVDGEILPSELPNRLHVGQALTGAWENLFNTCGPDLLCIHNHVAPPPATASAIDAESVPAFVRKASPVP